MASNNKKATEPKFESIVEEDKHYAEKFSVELKDLKWIRKAYAIKPKVGELKESFLKTLHKVIISKRYSDQVFRNAYSFYTIDNVNVRLYFNQPVWANDYVVKLIERTTVFIDDFDMSVRNKDHNIMDPKAKVLASDSQVPAYSISRIRKLDLNSKD